MKVCLVTSEYPREGVLSGGPGVHFENLAQGLVELGHEVHVVTLTKEASRKSMLGAVHLHEIHSMPPFGIGKWDLCDKLPLREIYRMWTVACYLSKICKEFSIDVIETTNFHSLCLFFAYFKNRPKLVTRVSTTMQGGVKDRLKKFSKKQRLVFWFEKLAVQKSDHLITHTIAHRDLVTPELQLSADDFKMIPHGIKIECENPTILEGKPNEVVQVLYVGRLEKRKGTDVLLEAIPRVVEKHPQVKFTLVGRDTSDKKWEREFFEKNGATMKESVVFAGPVSDEELLENYEKCHVYVAPARYESFGLTYVEAMSYGKPVIGCRAGGVPEVIADNVTGFLCEPNNAEDLCEKLLRLVSDGELRKKMGIAARERVMELFTHTKMAAKSVRYYQSVINPIFNIHRTDKTNVGDLASSPAKYFEFLEDAEVKDIGYCKNVGLLENKSLVIGGGGLLGTDFFDKRIEIIRQAKAKHKILWGAGHNAHDSKEIIMPDFLKSFDLVGVRDYGTEYEWVPCVSCLSPLFDLAYEVKYDVVVYDQVKHAQINLPGITKMSNDVNDFAKVVEFLGSAELVITSSYHGAYWATLLGKKVLLMNVFSSKFYGYKHPIQVVSEEDWQEKAKEAKVYPEALQECRKANYAFAEKVEKLIGGVKSES